MKKCVNGKMVEMTAEEIAAYEAEIRIVTIKENNRPLAFNEVISMFVTQQINTLSVDDNTALRMLQYYPVWVENTAYNADYKVQYNNKLYKCLQAHTSQVGWEPENGASLWTQINETHNGTLEDPIPYDGNMALVSGLYYVQNDVIYLCTRDTVNPVYSTLESLVGLYVEEV